MVILKYVVFAASVATVLSSPIIVESSIGGSSYQRTPSILSYSHTPSVTYSHAPQISYSHTPVVSYTHAPQVSYSLVPKISYSHVPAAVEHIPVEIEHHAPANYQFKYGVHDSHTHDIKEQAERRHGDRVEGHYSLVEPDGTTRTVHYTADKHTGFHAQVRKSGHASHPTTQKAQAVHVVAVPVHSTPTISYAPSYGQASSDSTYGSDSSYVYSTPSISIGSTHGYSSPSISIGTTYGSGSSYGYYTPSINSGRSRKTSYGGSYGYSSPSLSYGSYGSAYGKSRSQSYDGSYVNGYGHLENYH